MKEAFELMKEKIMQDRRIGRSSLEAFLEILNEVEAEYGKKGCALCYLGSPCEYQNEDVRIPDELMGWIPCSERLPEENGKYIVTVKNKTGFWILENNVFVCDYSFNTFIFQGWEDNEVIAWMPLPEPYKPET